MIHDPVLLRRFQPKLLRALKLDIQLFAMALTG